MKTLFLALLILMGSTARADAAGAYGAGVADCLTTGIGLSIGFVEFNPLGPVIACAMKPLVIEIADDLPEPSRTNTLTATQAVWTGAAFNNLALIVAKVLGVSAGPAAPLIGLVAAWHVWASTADEREFARLCAVHRALAEKPELACIFSAAP
jgi:hypothetical protein